GGGEGAWAGVVTVAKAELMARRLSCSACPATAVQGFPARPAPAPPPASCAWDLLVSSERHWLSFLVGSARLVPLRIASRACRLLGASFGSGRPDPPSAQGRRGRSGAAAPAGPVSAPQVTGPARSPDLVARVA